MGSAPRPEAILTAYVTALIRVKARQLVRDHLFRRSDEEDLRQELTLRLLKRARRYNPARASLHTFVDRVVASLAATLVRERRRQKNGARLASISLEVLCNCGDEGATPLRELLEAADLQRRTGGSTEDPVTRAERDEALHAAVAGLPQHLQEVCARLMHSSAVDVARDMGVTRHQVHKAIGAIRTHFRTADLN
jgi:RNA polymerase sigma factor (sigma-70 family)